ncbi:MAG: phosphoribosylglycinamide formyltransferase [Phycisphaerae bacterium]|nr:phosphoribosylglycinamide formyltransferase [Phycisphaerae bacterium]
MNTTLHIAACISGGGRTLMNIQDRIEDGALDASIDLVIASRPDCKGVERARDRGFDVMVAESGDHASDLLDPDSHDLVCLCGWLKHLRIDDWMHGRVMNIHPALLPAFGGKGMFGDHVHAAVLEAGVPVTGCTVHFVNEAYDEGPIILQRACPVEDGDDAERLAERVFALECEAFPEAIAMFAEGRLSLADDRVRIAPP